MLIFTPDVLDSHFDEQLKNLESEHWETAAYIKSTLKKYVRSDKDLSRQSVVLLWLEAQNTHKFELYQDVGDWVFFSRVMFPESISCDLDFYEGLGRSSYYKCYQLLHGAWPLYEELADRLPYFITQIEDSGFQII